MSEPSYKVFKSNEFVNRSAEIERVQAFLKEKSRGVMIFEGDRGSGKTSLLFELYRRLHKQGGVRPFLISLFSYSAPEFDANKNLWINSKRDFQKGDIPGLLSQIANYLEVDFIETDDQDFQKDYLARGLAYRKTSDVPILLVDSIYECSEDIRTEIEKFILAPILSSEQVFIILSGRGKYPIWSRPELQSAEILNLEPLDDAFIREQLEKLKELEKFTRDPSEMDAIVEYSGGNPLIARILATSEKEKPLHDALSEAIDTVIEDTLPAEVNEEEKYQIRSQLEKLTLVGIPFRNIDVEEYLYGNDPERRRKTDRLLNLLKASHLMVYEGKGNHLNQSVVKPTRKWLKAQKKTAKYLEQLREASLKLQNDYPTVKDWYEQMIPHNLINSH